MVVSAAFVGCSDSAKTAKAEKPCDRASKHGYFHFTDPVAAAAIRKDGPEKLRDLKDAMAQCQKATEQGDADAQNSLGYMYAYGLGGLTKDKAQAIAWYRKAADQGDTRALRTLSEMYDKGEGVAQDKAQAVMWLRKAAKQNDVYAVHAQRKLGDRYFNGEGVPQDKAQAIVWYRKAADQYDSEAQFRLAQMYEKGDGLTQSKIQAARLYCGSVGKGGASYERESIAGLERMGYTAGSCGLPWL